jgi:hypothetical protein
MICSETRSGPLGRRIVAFPEVLISIGKERRNGKYEKSL